MTVSNESKVFFKKLSKIWQNFKDYTYLEGINLSPEQVSIIEQNEDQLLIEGYAGTGKSLTLLYKFINALVREEGKRILFVTYNSTLIDDTKKRLNTSKEYRENVDKHEADVMTFHEMASHILKKIKVTNKGIGRIGKEKEDKIKGDSLRRIARIRAKYVEKNNDEYRALSKEEHLYSTHNDSFIREEVAWIKAMGFTNKDKYLITERIGRSKSIRLTRNQRKTIFKIYEDYQRELESGRYGGLELDLEDYALKLIENNYLITNDIKYDYIFVDEVQDLDPMQIMALCQLTKKSIVLSGDAKQRIYKKCPVKYEDLGLKVYQKGKRRVLNKNYRSTAEIVKLANSLNFSDTEEKLSTKQFVKNGDKPIIYYNKKINTTLLYIVNEIKKIHEEDPTKSIAIVHREEVKTRNNSKSEIRLFLERNLLQSLIDIKSYGRQFEYNKEKQIFYTNAYDVKGLEFDVVFILDFNKLYYPYKEGIDKIKCENDGKDQSLIDADILEFINVEKKLLYVAMTRAKEKLYLIGSGIKNSTNGDALEYISDFIYDFNISDYNHIGFVKKRITESIEKYNTVGYGRLFNDKDKMESLNKKIEKNKINREAFSSNLEIESKKIVQG